MIQVLQGGIGSQVVVRGQSSGRINDTQPPHLKKCPFYDFDYFKKNSV